MGSMLVSVLSSNAANLTWDPNVSGGTNLGGEGIWNGTTNWWNGSDNVVFASGDSVTFTGTGGDVAPHVVSVTAGVNVLNLDIASSNYQINSTSGEFALNNTGILSIGSSVTGTKIYVTGSYFRLNASSGGTVFFSNSDLVDFGTSMFGFGDNGRTLSVANSSGSGVTTLPKLAVTRSNAVSTGSTITGSGNVTINALGGIVSGNTFGTLNTTTASNNPALTYTGTGIITVNGNNTSFENTATGALNFNLNNASASLRLGHDNALGARNAGNALTDSGLILTAGTVETSGGPRNLENATRLAGNATVGGANAITFAGTFTNNGGNHTVTVNNSALTTLSGPVYLANDDLTARTMTIGGTGNVTISGAITNNASTNLLASSLTKSGSGLLTLGGTNTYTGNTTVNSGASLALASGGALKFVIGSVGVNNKITGAGSATLNGTFNIDLSEAGTPASGGVWTLVETGKTFGASFAVTGFTETPANGGLWVNGLWYFSELSGKLSYGTPPENFWDGDSGGAWSVGGNWTSGIAPVSGDTPVFTGTNTANNNDLSTGTLGNVTLGGIIFGQGASSFNLAGNAVNLSGKTITNYSANAQAIAMDIEANTGFNVDTSAGSITLTGALKTTSGFNQPLNKTGSGTLILDGTQSTSWNLQVNGGTLQVFNPNAGGQVTAFNCTIAAGAKLIGESGDILHFGLGLQNNGTFDMSANGEAFGNLNGSGVVTNHGSSPAVTSLLELGRGNSNFSGSIQDGPSGSLTSVRIFKVSPGDTGDYTHTFSGNNTYTGNTVIDQADQSFVLTSTGALKFKMGANGVSTQIIGAAQTLGTVTLNGTFNIDLTGASIANGNSWQIVAAALLPTTTFGANFNVAGFTEASDVWTKVDGSDTWTFSESTGVLNLASSGGGSYSTWASANGIDGEPAERDFDNDGLSNLMEYALGKNPTTSSQPAGVMSGNTITFTKGADAIANGDVSWVIEQSSNLGSWTPVVAQAAGDASPTISHSLPTGQPKVFARLKVVK
jgi:autotransporter-associated beta strand protein